MKAAVLTVGTEILFGSITNTNAVYLSQELQKLGVDVMYHMTVGDNAARLSEMLAYIYEDCDLIITTGGLGPTEDDLTKETIASYFGCELVENAEQRAILERLFEKFGQKMTLNNYKQVRFPVGSVIMPNPNGTAPGFILEKNLKMIASLPGPPREMTPMFENFLKPVLAERQSEFLSYKTLLFKGIGESSLETALIELIDKQTDPTLATYAKPDGITLRVASKRSTQAEADRAVDEMIEEVKKYVGEYIEAIE